MWIKPVCQYLLKQLNKSPSYRFPGQKLTYPSIPHMRRRPFQDIKHERSTMIAETGPLTPTYPQEKPGGFDQQPKTPEV